MIAQQPTVLVWPLVRIDAVGGIAATVKGAPRVIETPWGKAVEFDGQRDALVVPCNPLDGASTFTVEAIFRPDSGGEKEQRFLHLQAAASEDRVLLETRLADQGWWYADTFIRSGATEQPLNDPALLHPLGRWYNLALVFDGEKMSQYVDGQWELSSQIRYQPLREGQTSIGARLNDVYWFKGAIRLLRFTHRALGPDEFLAPG
jgi:hypothetical protein